MFRRGGHRQVPPDGAAGGPGRGRGPPVLVGRCDAGGPPYEPVAAALRSSRRGRRRARPRPTRRAAELGRCSSAPATIVRPAEGRPPAAQVALYSAVPSCWPRAFTGRAPRRRERRTDRPGQRPAARHVMERLPTGSWSSSATVTHPVAGTRPCSTLPGVTRFRRPRRTHALGPWASRTSPTWSPTLPDVDRLVTGCGSTPGETPSSRRRWHRPWPTRRGRTPASGTCRRHPGRPAPPARRCHPQPGRSSRWRRCWGPRSTSSCSPRSPSCPRRTWWMPSTRPCRGLLVESGSSWLASYAFPHDLSARPSGRPSPGPVARAAPGGRGR